ncbi:hypothetical protein BST61_g9162 [Cercospora zeina]
MEETHDGMPIHVSKGELVAGGISGIVELQEDGFVVKSPWPGDEEKQQCQRDLKLEAEVYRRLAARFPNHQRFIRLVSFDEATCSLTMEYMRNGTLRQYLQAHAQTITQEQRHRWALAAAEGLALLHSIGIVHCDFTPKNMLLDDQLALKIIDFGCCSLDGAQSSGGGDVRSYPWDEGTLEAQHDVFALGSTIYEISTGARPYHDDSSRTVGGRVQARLMPDVTELPLSTVIANCWLKASPSAEEIYNQLLEASLGR